MRQNGWFERRLRAPRLRSSSIDRQSRIVKMAIEHFGSGSAAMAFLNAADARFGGTPLTAALKSDAGFRKVARHIAPSYEPSKPVVRYPPGPLTVIA